MKKEEINRAFVEALLRLGIDSTNFKKLGIDKKLELCITNIDNINNAKDSTGKNVTLITFDTETSLWELNHNGIVTKNWEAPRQKFTREQRIMLNQIKEQFVYSWN